MLRRSVEESRCGLWQETRSYITRRCEREARVRGSDGEEMSGLMADAPIHRQRRGAKVVSAGGNVGGQRANVDGKTTGGLEKRSVSLF